MACSEKGQYLAQRNATMHRIVTAPIAAIKMVVRNLEFGRDRSVEERELVEPAVSMVDDMKL
jgi:hypothetical protein